MSRVAEVKHPYVHGVKSICGGEPVIRGTRFTVRAVAQYVYGLGMSAEEMVAKWTHLTLAQVYDALSYYHDHRPLIDRLIRENQESAVRKKIGV